MCIIFGMPKSRDFLALASIKPAFCRAQTTRLEIGYEVIEVEDDEDGELDIEIAFRVKEELRKCEVKDRGMVYWKSSNSNQQL
jgi:hypothetical protein